MIAACAWLADAPCALPMLGTLEAYVSVCHLFTKEEDFRHAHGLCCAYSSFR